MIATSGTTVVHNLYKIFPMSITRHRLVNNATQSARALMMLLNRGVRGICAFSRYKL